MSKQIQKPANPQGKGIVGVVDDLRNYAPLAVRAKSNHQWLADYFTSTLVLGSKYGFKPVWYKDYYLYFKQQEWKLSLIEPQAWKRHDPGTFFATCNLNQDMSWSLELAEDWQQDSILLVEIQKLEKGFYDSLGRGKSLVENLPFFIQSLSYYQRLGANALAQSLKISLELSVGIEKSVSYTSAELFSNLSNQKVPLLALSNE